MMSESAFSHGHEITSITSRRVCSDVGPSLTSEGAERILRSDEFNFQRHDAFTTFEIDASRW